MAEILVVDDERNVREGVRELLEIEGFSVRTAHDGEQALAEVARRRPDLVLLDVMMPKKGGYAVLAEIRRTDPLLPVLILSGRGDVIDKVHGLNLGADDYMEKTVYAQGGHELVARLRAALRRAQQTARTSREPPPPEQRRFAFGAHVVDAARQMLCDGAGGETPLFPREARLAEILAAHPGEVLDRERLVAELTGAKYLGNTHALDQTVCTLRRKLGEDGRLLQTVKNAGYRFAPA